MISTCPHDLKRKMPGELGLDYCFRCGEHLVPDKSPTWGDLRFDTQCRAAFLQRLLREVAPRFRSLGQDEAEDAMQDFLVRANRAIDTYDPASGRLDDWCVLHSVGTP